MDVKVCTNCRRLFNHIYGPELCSDCMGMVPEVTKETEKRILLGSKPDTEDEKMIFDAVKDYILMHPKATVMEIADANEITPSKLFEWVKDGKLEFTDDSMEFWFDCIQCGRKIRSGLFCNRCTPKR